MGCRPRSKTPFSTGTQCLSRPPVRTRLRRAHSAFRAYGEGHGSKRQRLYPPLHGGKPTKARWKFYVPSTGSVLQKQAEKYIRLQVPSLRHEQARSGRTASFAPTARATAANGNDCILRSTGESPTEADGKPYCPPTGSTPQRPGTPRLSRLRRGPQQQTAAMASSTPQGKALQKQMGSLIAHPQGVFRKGRRKSMQDGESLPCGMSRHPSFLYINRNLLANATCFFL